MKDTSAQKPFISIAKFAKESGFSRTTVTEAVKGGHIPTLQVNKRQFISRNWVRSWMESGIKTRTRSETNPAA